jgi:hypothetical protein
MPNLLLLTAGTVTLLSAVAMLTLRAAATMPTTPVKHRNRHRQHESRRAGLHELHASPRLPPGCWLRVKKSLRALVVRLTGAA